MTVTIIYPKEVAFPFNIPCLSNGDEADKFKCANMILKGLMGDGFEISTPTSKHLGVRPMRYGDMILFPDGETWMIGSGEIFRMGRKQMIEAQMLENNLN